MKRVIVVALALFLLGFAMPKQSEAGNAWVPAAIIGGIIVGAAISEAMDAGRVHACYSPAPVYVHRPPAWTYIHHPPARVYVNPHHRDTHAYYRGHGKKYGHLNGTGKVGPRHNRRPFPHR